MTECHEDNPFDVQKLSRVAIVYAGSETDFMTLSYLLDRARNPMLTSKLDLRERLLSFEPCEGDGSIYRGSFGGCLWKEGKDP
jgi:hypothetical protein